MTGTTALKIDLSARAHKMLLDAATENRKRPQDYAAMVVRNHLERRFLKLREDKT